MAFTNPPVKSIPTSAALGGQALKQVEGLARNNQVMPSPDIMVSRTTQGTFLALRSKAAGASGGSSILEMEVTTAAELPENPYNRTGVDDGTYISARIKGSTDVKKILLPQYLRLFYQPFSNALIRPSYKVGDIIYCLSLAELGPNGEQYVDVNADSRQWSVALTSCSNQVTTYYYVPVSVYP